MRNLETVRKFWIALVIVGLPLSLIAQKDEDKVDISNYDVTTIVIPAPDEKIKLNIPFTAVEVYDSRFDTSCLGVVKNGVPNRLRLLRSKRNIRHEIRAFYTQLADPVVKDSIDIELCCFIKKLILSDHVATDLNEQQKLSSKKYDEAENGGILFMAEFYARVGTSYIPLCRFDTILVGSEKIAKKGSNYLQQVLKASLQKIATIDWNGAMTKSKRLNGKEITKYNNDMFDIPILHSIPVKGIYRNFDDFKNNSPLEIEYSLDKNKTGDFLYIKNEKGEDELCNDLWGYSDGKDMFIFSSTNFFKLHRSHNGFKIYGAKDFTGRRKLRANIGLIDIVNPNSTYSKPQTRMKYYLVKSFFVLDMETGELY